MDTQLLKSDYNSTTSLIFTISITIVFITIGSFGIKILKTLTDEKSVLKIYIAILSGFWLLFLCIYFLKWNLENVFIFFLIVSIIVSFFMGMVMYYGQNICSGVEAVDNKYGAKLLLFLMMIIIFYLEFLYITENHVIVFIISLILLRISYYIIKKYEFNPVYKTMCDSILVIIIIHKSLYLYDRI